MLLRRIERIKMNITIGDMSEALAQLREEHGYSYSPSNLRILEKAIEIKKMLG